MSLRLIDLHRHYGPVTAVAGVTLTVEAEETVSLVGPSGCGKSTLLRLVAGLEAPDRGALSLDGRDLGAVPAQGRHVGMVFQDHALFPHLDVAGNVAFGLVERGVPRAERARRVAAWLERVGLGGHERRRPFELSGGQRQRVALARALAPDPELLLLDEPLSNLDRTLRGELLAELEQLLVRLPVRALFVTHDQNEAVTLGDRVAVMRAGRLVQVAPAETLLPEPRDAWTARFLGHRNVYPAGAVPGRPEAQPWLLREERLAPAADGERFEVRAARRRENEWDLRLHAPAWALEVAWRVRDRELEKPPRVGSTLHLRVPEDAWWPLQGEEVEA